MQYAVIKAQGKQYRIGIGDVVTVDRLSQEEKKSVIFNDVLLLVNDGKIVLGNPIIKGARVEAVLVENKRGKKINVRKFKAKVRYRKNIGFRANQSVIKIEKIDYKSMFSSKKLKKEEKPAPKS